jgi:pSer/pThr/pTyr-binding forkhead associated (FHA) protein
MGDSPYRVKVTRGGAQEDRFDVIREALVLGSGAEADIRLEGEGVEPRHAQVVFQGGRVLLEDLGTQAGTFRNGQRLLAQAQIFPGDRIGLGPVVELILEGEDPTQAAPAADDDLAADPGTAAPDPGPAA